MARISRENSICKYLRTASQNGARLWIKGWWRNDSSDQKTRKILKNRASAVDKGKKCAMMKAIQLNYKPHKQSGMALFFGVKGKYAS